MRIPVLLFGSLLLAMASLSPARAGWDGCCGPSYYPSVVYAPAPAPVVIARPAYLLDPSDDPYYVVNQGQYSCSCGYPYWGGGYALARPYVEYPHDYPYVVSHGWGIRYHYHAWHPEPAFVRPWGPFHTAYRWHPYYGPRILHARGRW